MIPGSERGVEAATMLHPNDFHPDIVNVKMSELHYQVGMYRPFLIMSTELTSPHLAYQLWMLP